MSAVNSMSYEGKDVVLDVIRQERQAFYDIIDDPANWNVDTRCEGWEVHDIVGHMIDVTEDEWNNFLVTHAFMGPFPTLFYPAFHVMDYGVHTIIIEVKVPCQLFKRKEFTT